MKNDLINESIPSDSTGLDLKLQWVRVLLVILVSGVMGSIQCIGNLPDDG